MFYLIFVKELSHNMLIYQYTRFFKQFFIAGKFTPRVCHVVVQERSINYLLLDYFFYSHLRIEVETVICYQLSYINQKLCKQLYVQNKRIKKLLLWCRKLNKLLIKQKTLKSDYFFKFTLNTTSNIIPHNTKAHNFS